MRKKKDWVGEWSLLMNIVCKFKLDILKLTKILKIWLIFLIILSFSFRRESFLFLPQKDDESEIRISGHKFIIFRETVNTSIWKFCTNIIDYPSKCSSPESNIAEHSNHLADENLVKEQNEERKRRQETLKIAYLANTLQYLQNGT